MSDTFPTEAELEFMEERLLDCARNVTCPVLMIRGKMTDMVSLNGVASLRKTVPQAEFVDLDDAAHMVAGDNNDAFTATLLSFLNRQKARL